MANEDRKMPPSDDGCRASVHAGGEGRNLHLMFGQSPQPIVPVRVGVTGGVMAGTIPRAFQVLQGTDEGALEY